ncbi:Ent-kaurene synthase [Hypoxylon sp. EC38]|nr:Ent-kaurene synthase [Hypoxylon sp. EC38]
MFTSLSRQSELFIKRIAAQCASGQGFGSFSPSIYDTAWLSMIEHPYDKVKRWLFPECFEFILQSQSEDGSWESYSSQIDGILNTASALLSLKKHLAVCPDHPCHEEWTRRRVKAQVALGNLLKYWNVSSSDQVGFEILIMKHLSLLENEGISFQFPQYHALRALYDAKLKRLSPDTILKTHSTLYHSLEALIGHVDFDQISRWQEEDGSMLGSPSSTAAYLIHTSLWDTRAEGYLRSVLRFSTGNGNGGVPCAWPTSVFETAWVVTTLAAVGIVIHEPEASTLRHFLESSLERGNGTVGFSPTSIADVDDTAKTILALSYFNKSVDIHPLIQTFESTDHFNTYPGERNPSFSANCNVLICLLSQSNLSTYITQITKTTAFLCSQAFMGSIREKWHIHELYWMMLFSQAISLLHDRVRDGSLNEESFGLVLRDQIPLVSLQILVRIMYLQRNDGSWDGICEITAYAILAISWLLRLPWCQRIFFEKTIPHIHLGQAFLHSNRSLWARGHYLWIEKTTYASNTLAEAYCLAAASVSFDAPIQSRSRQIFMFRLPDSTCRAMSKAKELLRRVPLFSGVDSQILNAAEFQACYEFSNLYQRRLEIFPRTGMGEDRYLTLIPFTWMACNVLQGGSMNQSVLQDMIFLSMINYQVDEYMEIVIQDKFKGDLNTIKKVISNLCSDINQPFSDINGVDNNIDKESAQNIDSELLGEIKVVLRNYVAHILQHPGVLSRPLRERANLASELQTFLLAHITHAEDNRRFFNCRSQSPSSKTIASGAMQYANGGAVPLQYTDSRRTFYNWVRSTSADHTSCPFSWKFFNCLIAETCGSVYATAASSYVAEDMVRHLASLCRMYNDYGSISRDSDEGNLNSINFPEFHLDLRGMESIGGSEAAVGNAKDKLMLIAEYERHGLNIAMAELEAQLGKGKLFDAVKLFVNVTDLYGQIYVEKDIATRKQ